MTMPGGWKIHDTITEEDKKIFDTAMSGLKSVKYEPIKVATQVVNGINYCYICKSKVIIPNTEENISKVTIYKPVQGNPIITGIEKIL